jgi:hypothetical protein
MDGPEVTKKDVENKLGDESDEIDALGVETHNTNDPGLIPVDPSPPEGQPVVLTTTTRQRYNYLLQRKKDALAADRERLRSKLSAFDTNITDTKKDQKEQEASQNGVTLNNAILSARSYLNRTTSARRARRAGKKGGQRSA